MKDKINILIPCAGHFSLVFLDLLTHSIDKLSSGEYDITYLIGINSEIPPKNYVEDFKNLLADKINPSKIYTCENNDLFKNLPQEVSSTRHGKNLQGLLEYSNAKYSVICDVDTAVITKNWDKLLINELKDDKIIIGSHYRRSVATGKYAKYSNFPNQFFCLFKTKEFKSCVKTLIPTLKKVHVTNQNVNIYGPPVDRQILLDTFHNAPEFVIPAGYGSVCLESVCSQFESSIVTKKYDLAGDEFILNNKSIALHHGRSITSSMSKKWRKAVHNLIDQEVQLNKYD